LFDPYSLIVDFLFLILIPTEILVLILADVLRQFNNTKQTATIN
jgi:hypothetical protein